MWADSSRVRICFLPLRSAFGFGAVGFRFLAGIRLSFGIIVVFAVGLTTGLALGCFGSFSGRGFLFGLLAGRFFLGGRGFDLGFDLVAEIYLGRTVGVIVGRKVVLAAELTEFGSTHFKLVGDPGVGPSLTDPGPNLVELGA